MLPLLIAATSFTFGAAPDACDFRLKPAADRDGYSRRDDTRCEGFYQQAVGSASQLFLAALWDGLATNRETIRPSDTTMAPADGSTSQSFALVLAIAAACVSALSAIIVAVYQTRASRRHAQEIESLRAALGQESARSHEVFKRYLEQVVEGGEEEVQSFKRLLSAVQVLRDRVAQVVAHPERVPPRFLGEELHQLSNAVVHQLSEAQVHLKPEDYHLSHQLKNDCIRLVESLTAWYEAQSATVAAAVMTNLREALESAQHNTRERQAALRLRATTAIAALTKDLERRVR